MNNLLLRNNNSLEQGPPAEILFPRSFHQNFVNSGVHERLEGI